MSEPLTPETVLMNCLEQAERLDQIMILVYTKDGVYEYWSNNLPSHQRLGLIAICKTRIENSIETIVDE